MIAETMFSEEQIEAFIQSRSHRPQWIAVPERLRPRTTKEGYGLQSAIYDRLAQMNMQRAGYKIGCISPESQQEFGLNEPIYAAIFKSTAASSLGEALSRPLVKASAECEIAVMLRLGLDALSMREIAQLSPSDLVGQVSLACEIVDSRYGVSPATVGAPTLLADDYLHASFILAEPRPLGDIDLTGPFSASLVVDGRPGVPAPGSLSPAAALAWLIRKLEENGETLRGGEMVLTGSLFKPVPVSGDSKLTMKVDGLGELRT